MIKSIRKKLVESDKESYIGPKAILKYIHRNKEGYKDKENINLSSINIPFITSTLKEFKLSKHHKKRIKGGSKYQHYPEVLINQIGNILLEIDFIQRFIKEQNKPLHFMGLSHKMRKFKQFKRISRQTSINVIKELKWFLENFKVVLR